MLPSIRLFHFGIDRLSAAIRQFTVEFVHDSTSGLMCFNWIKFFYWCNIVWLSLRLSPTKCSFHFISIFNVYTWTFSVFIILILTNNDLLRLLLKLTADMSFVEWNNNNNEPFEWVRNFCIALHIKCGAIKFIIGMIHGCNFYSWWMSLLLLLPYTQSC